MFSFRSLNYSPHLPQGYRRDSIPTGTAGTHQTIRSMQKMVSAVNNETIQAMQGHVASGKRHMKVRRLAGELVRKCTQKDYECYSREFYLFCRDRIWYAWDPVNVELVEHPNVVLDTGIADCDSIVVLLAALHEQVGIPGRYVTIKADPSQPGEYSHVYFQALIPAMNGQPSRWVSMDPTMKSGMKHQWGWSPPGKYPTKYWSASTDPMASGGRDASIMGLGEGSIPGVIETDILQGPGQEYRQIDNNPNLPPAQNPLGVAGMRGLGYDDEGAWDTVDYGSGISQSFGEPDLDQDTAMALNESYGNPSLGRTSGLSDCHTGCNCPSCESVQEPGGSGYDTPLVLNGIAEGEDLDQGMVATVVAVYDGSAAKEYETLKRKHEQNQSMLASRLKDIQTMRPGPLKEKAKELWGQAQSSFVTAQRRLNEIRTNYNETRALIIKYVKIGTLNQYTPDIPSLSGLGSMGVAPILVIGGGAVLAAVLAYGSDFINSLSNAFSGAKGAVETSRGFIDRATDAITAGGGVVKETAGLVRALSIAALIGGGLFVGYSLLKGRRRSAPAGTALAIKPVQGTVR